MELRNQAQLCEGEIIASQNSMQKKCEKWVSFLQEKFENCLLESKKRNKYYIDISNPISGDFFIWIFDKHRNFTQFGLKCESAFLYMDVSIVRRMSHNELIDENSYITQGLK